MFLTLQSLPARIRDEVRRVSASRQYDGPSECNAAGLAVPLFGLLSLEMTVRGWSVGAIYYSEQPTI